MTAALLILPSCTRGGGRGGFAFPPVPVEISEVRPETLRERFEAVGSVESEKIVEVVSELDATVTRIPFVEGRRVEHGALIAQLDDRAPRAAAERAEARREQAEANAARAEKLFERQAISSQDLDDSRTALKVARADEELAKAILDKTRIRAPFAGLAGRRRVSPGAYLNSGDVITDLARVDEMKVTFAAPERYLREIEPGAAVEVSTPAYPGEVFKGEVSVVDPIVDTRTRTIQLVARVPNPAGRLRPGMSANVSVILAERPNALIVPDEAVFAEGNQSFVYVLKPDSSVSRTPVRTGLRDSSRVEVVTGLTAGARVVNAGHQKLFDGAKVMPIPAGMMGAGGPGGAAPGGAEPGGAAPGGAAPDSSHDAKGAAAPAGAGRGGSAPSEVASGAPADSGRDAKNAAAPGGEATSTKP